MARVKCTTCATIKIEQWVRPGPGSGPGPGPGTSTRMS